MKILVLTSRYTASRDIIGEDFGRQTRIFEALAKLSNEIDFFCADYNKFEKRDLKLHDINVFIRPFGLKHFLNFLKDLKIKLESKKYDALIATSDPLWGLIGYIFARKHKIKFIYDLHDNYETYTTYRIPFFKYFDRYAVKHCDIVTTVSYALKEKISKIRKKNVFVIQNGVNLKLFRPLDRKLSRKKLKIPLDAKIIAYTGSIQKTLGVDILINVFQRLRKEMPDAKLLLVGRLTTDNLNNKEIPDIKHKDIISFDAIQQEDVVLAINSADVVIIPSPSNEFTKYCFPYKCVEYMACNTPIVAAGLSDVKLMLKDYKDSLFTPDDENDLYRKIKIQLKKKKIDYRKKLKDYTWDKIALKLNKIMENF